VILTGLTPSTVYHFQVHSRDGLGLFSSSSDLTFTTPAAPPQVLLQFHSDETEISSGLTNGSVVTPTIGPAGFTGKLVVKSGGAVAFTPAQSGNGVYFTNCCTNTSNAYYKFTGAAVGDIFDVTQGEVFFYLKSRSSFSQRLTAGSYRATFDVRDNDGANHLFYFQTAVSGGMLEFLYRAGSTASSFYYFVPKGTEDALFGAGVVLKVRIAWDGTTSRLYLNDAQVHCATYTKVTPNWTSLSNFNLGAWEYSTFGGYDSSDDVIDEFTVTRGR
jgi:hypothetical protein